MATIPQKQLFGWQEIQELGDLDRLRLVLDYLPDEPLMRKLESHRARGRNDSDLPAGRQVRAVVEFSSGRRCFPAPVDRAFASRVVPQRSASSVVRF